MKNNNNIFISNSYKIFLSIILIFHFNRYAIKSFLLFPIEYIDSKHYKFTSNNYNIKNPEEIIQEIFYKNIITKIEIGNPPQTIPFFIKTNDDIFQIASINPSKSSKNPIKNSYYYDFTEKEIYNESLSSSYKEEKCEELYKLVYHYNEICYSKEIINFNYNNNKILEKEFPIKLIKNLDENIPGSIGLLFNNSFFETTKSFITLLKSENIINNYYYFLYFEEIAPLENKLQGELIIGGLPHEVFPEKYSIDDFQITNCHIASYIPSKWRLNMDKIYLNDNYEKIQVINSLITLNYEIYHIIGTIEFHQIIKTMFMDKLIDDKKCFLSNFSQNLHGIYNISFYYCQKSVKNVLYENLKSIKFYSIKLDYIFELTNVELFYIKDNYIYLNILFSQLEYNYWTMGQLFTIKYNFIFNTNQKQIGFYTKIKNDQINDKNNNKNNNKNNESNNVLVVISFIACIFIFTCLGIYIGRKIFGWRRKVIANELIEELNYEYKIENNTVKPNIIESKYKSIGNKDNLFFEMKNKSSE